MNRDPRHSLRLIVSGGQTGADRAALDAALAAGFPCGGWCPEGRQAEDGVIPDRYPLEELPGAGPRQRTIRNVVDADGTAILYRGTPEGGTELTLAHAIKKRRPYLLIDSLEISPERAGERLAAFVVEAGIGRLNVAGPRASKDPGVYDFVHEAVTGMLEILGRS